MTKTDYKNENKQLYEAQLMKHSVQIKGKKLSFLDVGQGEVLLFGHSYLFDHRMWRFQIEALSTQYLSLIHI